MATRTKRAKAPSLYAYPQYPTHNAHLAPANRAALHQELREAAAFTKATARTLRGAILATGTAHAPSPEQLAQWRADHNAAIHAYNAAVTAWHDAWAAYREAERARRREVANQQREANLVVQRAKLRAATCATCGTIHAGEC